MTKNNLNLEKIRIEIESIDQEILTLLSKRLLVVKQVAEYKYRVNKPIKDSEREQELLNKLITYNNENNLNLNPNFIKEIYQLIISNSCEHQQELINLLKTKK